ncbi:unnamed protein product, partial [Mesorhabditis belari]|uniref:GSKIP domain-containing protein n=1 Tax=Mesorhabditis belari TaxID=2138241 RepID=A0AAF3FHQ9_9BILA
MATPPHTPVEGFSPTIASPGEKCGCATVPLVGSLVANTLADSLGVSPLYKQQDSARWNSAAQVYKSSRCVSPTQTSSSTQFNFDGFDPISPPEISLVKPHNLVASLRQSSQGNVKTPLNLEEIGEMNRRRHLEMGGMMGDEGVGALELEAIAAVHELAHEVESISVSEILPRTSDLIFVNVKTHEGQPYTLELTMKGWRVASEHTDCMNGDYTKVELHTKYHRNARELLSFVSPDHTTRFNESLAEKLRLLQAISEQQVVAN